MPKKSKSGEPHEAIKTSGRGEMDEIDQKIIRVIQRLKGEEGQHLHFFLLDKDSHLKNYGIFRKDQTNWWQWLWGNYTDISVFYNAILNEFGLMPAESGEPAYPLWFTVQDVMDYVRRRLKRKEKQREQEPSEQRKQEPSEQLDKKEREREKRSKRMKRYWKARKQRELQEYLRRKKKEEDRQTEKERQQEERRNTIREEQKKKEEEKRRKEQQERERKAQEERERRSRAGGDKNLRVEDFWLEILELSRTATQEEIKNKYRQLIMKAHPDRGGDPHHFRMIQKAYEYLMKRQ